VSNQAQTPAQYPAPRLSELDRASLRDVADGLCDATPQQAKDAAAEIARRIADAA
jgi:hypothetical protein